MSNISKRRREGRVKTLGDHKEFLKRITKSLYYGQLPNLPCLSLPVTEISAELFSEAQRGRSLKRLHMDEAAEVTRSACVSPCSLVLAILYLERLKTANPEYIAKIAPSELFLVSLMVSNKFLQDDGEEDEVFCDEWATSGGVNISNMKHLEKNFLNAIDWQVYVSEKTFEAGLSWLERQVALKQASLRGFFTYTDLTATTSELRVGEFLKSFSSICLTMTVSYITSLLAVVTSTLLISNSLLPSLNQQSALTSSPLRVDTNSVITALHSSETADPSEISISSNALNETGCDIVLGSLEKLMTTQSEINKMACCTQQWEFNENIQLQTTDWLDGIVLNTRRDTQHIWWWQTSAINWLHQFSLITPLQKWLDNVDQLSNFIAIDILNYTQESCEDEVEGEYQAEHGTFYSNNKKCNLWLNKGTNNNFFVSVSDR